MLLREENARLKAAEHQGAGHRRRCSAARARCRRRAIDDDSVADETTRVLVEGLVIRESLLEICQEIERAMVSFEARLKALESTGSLQWPPRRALELAPGAATRAAAARAGAGTRPRILLTTEGTYPYAHGRRQLVVRPAGPRARRVRLARAADRRPARARAAVRAAAARARGRADRGLVGGAAARAAAREAAPSLPGVLVRGLLGWDGDTDAVARGVAVVPPPSRGRAPRVPLARAAGRRSWTGWRTCSPSASRRPGRRRGWTSSRPRSSTRRSTGSRARRPCRRRAADVLHVTAAGWSAIPALVHKALHGTPMVLTEHGVYLREAYLAAARGGGSPGARFTATRLARGLARAAYAGADVICPVTDANAYWEMGLGIDPAKILVLYNGLRQPDAADAAARRGASVVSVGRIDPLKDIHTLLRVAAETLRMVPDARFRHYGSVTDGEEAYERSCLALHARLGLGERFRFMGRTTDPNGAVRGADVVLMTSISEGLPMSVLEAMSQGRPVVSTCVGGVPTSSRAAARDRARRRPRAGDGRRDAAAQPGPGVAARAARPRPARADLQRGGVRRGLPRAARTMTRERALRAVPREPGRAAGAAAGRGAARARAAGRARGRRRARGVGGRAGAARARDGPRR